jgi:hypothetical protein
MASNPLLFLLFRIVCGASVTHRAFAPRSSAEPSFFQGLALRRSFFEILKLGFRALISADSSERLAREFSFYSSARGLAVRCRGPAVVKDKILCFVCAVKNIERTFNTYYELQEHLYRDHDMKKDPAMDIFNKYKNTGTETPTAER